MMSKRIIAILVACILATQVSFGDVWEDIAGYEYGDEPNPCVEAEKLLQDTPVNKYGPIEEKLIAVVASTRATQTGKAVSCRFLQQVGTDRCIPAVSGLLRDEVLCDYARLVLERLKSTQADKAMRDRLDAAPDKAKVGIIASLGRRRDAKAVNQIAKFANSRNPALAKAAIQALGNIGGKEAAARLSSMKPGQKLVPTQMHAMVACARSLSGRDAVALCDRVLAGPCSPCRIAALRELTNADAAKASSLIAKALKGSDSKLRKGAIGIVADTEGKALTRDMVGLLNELAPDRKAELIVALGSRGDKAALDSMAPHIRSKQPVVRDAAIKAASKLGDARIVKLLLVAADSSELGAVVTQAIAGMKGGDINSALVEALGVDGLRSAAIQACIARGCAEAAPDLLKLAADRDPDVRKEAWTGLGALAAPEDMDSVMKTVVKIKDAGDLSDAEGAIRKIFSRADDRSKCFEVIAGYFGQATEATKGVILDLGAEAGDSNALKLERKVMASGNKALYGRALRALAKWPNKSAAGDLLGEATKASQEVDRIVALRGYIRIAGMESARLSATERLGMFKTALKLTKRDSEKKQIVAGLQYATSLEALDMLAKYMDDPAFHAEAEMSAANLISKLYKKHPAEAGAMAQRLLKSKNKTVVGKAKKVVGELNKR